MAKEVIKNASLFLHGQKLASNINQVDFSMDADAVETTNFASGGAREFVQGLRSTSLSTEAMLEGAAEPQASLQAVLENETEAAYTVTKTYPPVAGDVAWFAKVIGVTHAIQAKIGELYRASLKFANRARPCRGSVLEYNAGRTSTGNSASLTIAAVGATEKLVGTVHVVSVSGTTPTLDILIQSDADNTYGSPTTRVTVPQFTAVGSYHFVIDGAITDTEVRVNATVGGTNPVFEYLVAIGIAAL